MQTDYFKPSSFWFFLLMFIPNIYAGSSTPKNLTESKVNNLPVAGIYTSEEEIENNQPKHVFNLQIKKYNSVDVYYVQKVKMKLLKLLNEALAISDGKDLFITIGNFRNKKGFIKTNYGNWHLKPANDKEQTNLSFPPGYYRTYNFSRKPSRVDSTIQMIQQGRKAIYQLAHNQQKRLTGIVAVSDGKDMYIKIGRYHNKPAFAKSMVKGRFYYFEVESSIVNEEQNFANFGGLAGLANAQLAKELPAKEKAGILLNIENQKLFVLGDYRSFKKDAFTTLITKYPKVLIGFLRADRKSFAKRRAIDQVNRLKAAQAQ